MRHMAFLIPFFVLAFEVSYAADCANISGKFLSDKAGYVKRVLTIEQKGCSSFVLGLESGTPIFKDAVEANGVPYTYYSHDKSGNGSLVPNGQSIESSTKDRFRVASFIGGVLSVKDVTGWSQPADQCVLDHTYQPKCTVYEISYRLKDANTLIETHMGHWFSQGSMIPESIEYRRVK